MREIVLDTETTGLDPESGDRIVEIGAVELFNHLPTGRTYHQYVNPQRDMPQEAFEVHGLSTEFLSDKPPFSEIAPEFLAFVADDPLVIHNASFDIRFLDAELTRAGLPPFGPGRAIDTLAIARRKFPGAPASLDALCRRFGIDNSSRSLHGALLDSEILAEVYLELIGGRQPGFALAEPAPPAEGPEAGSGPDSDALPSARRHRPRPQALPSRLSNEEAAAHAAFVESMGENALWKRFS